VAGRQRGQEVFAAAVANEGGCEDRVGAEVHSCHGLLGCVLKTDAEAGGGGGDQAEAEAVPGKEAKGAKGQREGRRRRWRWRRPGGGGGGESRGFVTTTCR
jgi:hypothetical protein